MAHARKRKEAQVRWVWEGTCATSFSRAAPSAGLGAMAAGSAAGRRAPAVAPAAEPPPEASSSWEHSGECCRSARGQLKVALAPEALAGSGKLMAREAEAAMRTVTGIRRSDSAIAMALYPYTTACSPNKINLPGAEATLSCSIAPRIHAIIICTCAEQYEQYTRIVL